MMIAEKEKAAAIQDKMEQEEFQRFFEKLTETLLFARQEARQESENTVRIETEGFIDLVGELLELSRKFNEFKKTFPIADGIAAILCRALHGLLKDPDRLEFILSVMEKTDEVISGEAKSFTVKLESVKDISARMPQYNPKLN